MGFSGTSAMTICIPSLPRPSFSLSSSHCLSLLTAIDTAFSTSCISFPCSSWLLRGLSYLFQVLFVSCLVFSLFFPPPPQIFHLVATLSPFTFTLTCLFPSPTSYVMWVLRLPLLFCRFSLPSAHNPSVPQSSLSPSNSTPRSNTTWSHNL